MTVPRFRPMENLVAQERALARHRENSSRLAHSFGTYEIVGWGEHFPEDPIMFESPYIYRPAVLGVGSSLKDEDSAEDIRLTRYPRVGGTVVSWHKTAGGLYTGADVCIWVEDRSPFIEPTDPDPDPNYVFLVDFTFLGIATKDIPAFIKGDLREV